MPKIAIDYSKTIIYKLVCNDLTITDLYVGHTTSFTKRKGKHKSNCNNENSKEYNYKVYQTIRANGGWDNWNMVQVEEHCCNNRREAEARERYWYEQLKANLNINYPARTKKEHYEENKEKTKEQHKEYYEENKEKLKEQHKEYYEENKEKILENSKEYYEDNKEKILEYQKKYADANKDKISKQQKEYNELNKERIKEYHKKWYEENKERKKEYQKKYEEENKENIKEYKKQYFQAKKLNPPQSL
jgi:hypothetical protein